MNAWKPGDVAMHSAFGAGVVVNSSCHDGTLHIHPQSGHWDTLAGWRPVVVIDPKDRKQVERLAVVLLSEMSVQIADITAMQDALREFANPTPTEPSDPRARVTDRRENIWRLLADGEWVCTSGPDIGEYVTWSQLAGRGPLEVEVKTP